MVESTYFRRIKTGVHETQPYGDRSVDTSISVDNARNEVLRKIGRNVVLFQQLEGLMKELAARQGISTPVSRLKVAHEERRVAVENHTMGQLVGSLVQNLYGSDAANDGTSDEAISEPCISFKFRIESDAAFVESRSKALGDVVAARNELIHKLLPRWKSDSIDSCQELERFLDEQAAPVRAEIAHFKEMLRAIHEHGIALKAFVDSEEGKKTFELMWLQQSRIVLMLGDIAQQSKRADGWAYLSTAGNILKQKAPEEFTAIESRYKCASLLDLILAAEVFDVVREHMPTGGVRVLYRIKPEWTLEL